MVVTTSIDSKEFRIQEYYIKILNKENTFLLKGKKTISIKKK